MRLASKECVDSQAKTTLEKPRLPTIPVHPNVPDDPTLVVVRLLLLPPGSAADGGSALSYLGLTCLSLYLLPQRFATARVLSPALYYRSDAADAARVPHPNGRCSTGIDGRRGQAEQINWCNTPCCQRAACSRTGPRGHSQQGSGKKTVFSPCFPVQEASVVQSQDKRSPVAQRSWCPGHQPACSLSRAT